MTTLSPARPGKWTTLAGVSLAFFLLNAATFTSLGIVLFTMTADLHWSMTSAGLSFMILGVACGLSSPLAAVAMLRLGGRGAVASGGVVLAAGFLAAGSSDSLWLFFAAMVLLGVGFTLAGNVPGAYLIAGWFGPAASRMIGYYYMLGALGAACGPPVVEAIVRRAGWRAHWHLMAAVSVALAAICFLILRDPAAAPPPPPDAAGSAAGLPGWTTRRALLTPPVILISAAATATMTCVTTNSSILVAHLARLGTPAEAGAFVLSAGAFAAMLAKGVSGRLCEHVPPALLLAIGLVLQAVGCLLLAGAATPLQQYASALTFGIGWGAAFVCTTVLPLDMFGPVLGGKILAAIALMTTCAAAGPVAAGVIADRTGGFGPIYVVYAGGLVVLTVLVVAVLRKRTGGRVPLPPDPPSLFGPRLNE